MNVVTIGIKVSTVFREKFFKHRLINIVIINFSIDWKCWKNIFNKKKFDVLCYHWTLVNFSILHTKEREREKRKNKPEGSYCFSFKSICQIFDDFNKQPLMDILAYEHQNKPISNLFNPKFNFKKIHTIQNILKKKQNYVAASENNFDQSVINVALSNLSLKKIKTEFRWYKTNYPE